MSPLLPPPSPRPLVSRTYVVFRLPVWWDGRAAPAVLGTVQARSHATAGAAARRLAAGRASRGRLGEASDDGGHAVGDDRVRWRAAGGCRRGWLLEALARDGAAAATGPGRRPGCP